MALTGGEYMTLTMTLTGCAYLFELNLRSVPIYLRPLPRKFNEQEEISEIMFLLVLASTSTLSAPCRDQYLSGLASGYFQTASYQIRNAPLILIEAINRESRAPLTTLGVSSLEYLFICYRSALSITVHA